MRLRDVFFPDRRLWAVEDETGFRFTNLNETLYGMAILALNGVVISSDHDECRMSFTYGAGVGETVEREFEYKGGAIVFPLHFMATTEEEMKSVEIIRAWFQGEYASFIHRLNRTKRLKKTLKQTGNTLRISIGRFMEGTFRDPDTGAVFNEKSRAVEILGVGPFLILAIAGKVAKALKQEVVFTRDYEHQRSYLGRRR